MQRLMSCPIRGQALLKKGADVHQGTRDPNEPRESDQEGLSPDQVKEAVTLVRDHLVQSVPSNSCSSNAWPML